MHSTCVAFGSQYQLKMLYLQRISTFLYRDQILENLLYKNNFQQKVLDLKYEIIFKGKSEITLKVKEVRSNGI